MIVGEVFEGCVLLLSESFKSLHLLHRYSIEMTEKSLMDGINEYLPPISQFLVKHVGPQAKDKIKILEVKDIEETIWSPR